MNLLKHMRLDKKLFKVKLKKLKYLNKQFSEEKIGIFIIIIELLHQ